MPRRARVTPGGLVYHVLNRTVAGLPLFRKEADFEAFERIMIEAHQHHPLRILAWCLMRNHWHFVVWPRQEGDWQLLAKKDIWERGELPPAPAGSPSGWRRLIDTFLPSPIDCQTFADAPAVTLPTYLVQPRSLVLLAAELARGT